jgi:hypothetical protein
MPIMNHLPPSSSRRAGLFSIGAFAVAALSRAGTVMAQPTVSPMPGNGNGNGPPITDTYGLGLEIEAPATRDSERSFQFTGPLSTGTATTPKSWWVFVEGAITTESLQQSTGRPRKVRRFPVVETPAACVAYLVKPGQTLQLTWKKVSQPSFHIRPLESGE